MASKKQVIGRDGQVKTVVKKSSSREHRVEQHMHGRSDHIRVKSDGLKYAIYAFVTILTLGFIALFLWLVLR